ncbi:hypothetical protein PP175_28750 (plasmid) [Aneurinibacillus sp. Ricciae_BoGa-3]|uniref:hypothetical protein n=1 Tax=Aneurinibacillus sp. Ricciae_BoGa-3 TaxID=3022697 RepID=UPI00234266CD|nr:hypothetical protein [Aneurinibacillus sp. Ricciae_BoGa-3]WCK57180.1 hypothetical protein PP175_28750 [Aneurinibacillus sp. Ricciae_BoGa-3]
MDFYQACESMTKGNAVESLVSKTIYEMSEKGLLAEGMLVPLDYVTVEEANGEWQEVTIIESMEDFEKLSPEQKQRILSNAYQHAKFNERHGR